MLEYKLRNTTMKKIILTLSLLATALFANNAEELFMNKCAICHVMERPANKSEMIAPPAKGIMFHMGEEIGSDEDILAHIKSFTINPTKEKAICRSVKRFGLMPSQKDNITAKELDIVAKWMIANLKMTEQEYKNRKRKGKGGGR